MIQSFRWCTDDGLSFSPNISADIKSNVYEHIDEETYMRFLKSTTTGVSWVHNSENLTIMEKGVQLKGLPSPDHGKVIVIYPIHHSKFPAPKNAVVYNDNGSIHKILQTPKLISEIAKKRLHRIVKSSDPSITFFEGVQWHQEELNHQIVPVLRIGFDMDWHEERILEPHTGEFGQCVSSGLR
jgi:hypothetical protein